MQETKADLLLIKISGDFSVETIQETSIDTSEGDAEVVSEREGDRVSMVAKQSLPN